MTTSETIIQKSKHMTSEELAKEFYQEHGDKSLEIFNGILIYLDLRQKVTTEYFLEVRNHLLKM